MPYSKPWGPFANFSVVNSLFITDFNFAVFFTLPQGYYKHKEVFGVKGDFTTSPEVNQVFGEVLIVILCSYACSNFSIFVNHVLCAVDIGSFYHSASQPSVA